MELEKENHPEKGNPHPERQTQGQSLVSGGQLLKDNCATTHSIEKLINKEGLRRARRGDAKRKQNRFCRWTGEGSDGNTRDLSAWERILKETNGTVGLFRGKAESQCNGNSMNSMRVILAETPSQTQHGTRANQLKPLTYSWSCLQYVLGLDPSITVLRETRETSSSH